MSKKPNNLTPKILALFFAIFLWSYVMGVENPETVRYMRNVDVSYQNTADLKRRGLVVMEPSEFKANVKVAGKKSEVDKFFKSYSKNIVAQVDLSGYGEGEHKVAITASIRDTSANVRIEGVEPKEMLVRLDKVIPKEKPINIVSDGEVADGYILDSLTSIPQTIFISGPRTWVNEVAEARVVVNMEGRTSSTRLTLPVQLLDDQGEEVRGIDKDPGMVEVDINILKKKTLPIKLQTEGDLPDNYNLSDIKLSPDKVTIKGENGIEELEFINTKAINVNDLINNKTKEVELDLPEGISLVNPNEKILLDYNLEEIITRDFDFKAGEIEARNLETNLELLLGEEDITIKLKGRRDLLTKLTKNQIKLFVDLKDLGEGSHEVDIKLDPIDGLQVEGLGPEKIRIELKSKDGEEKEEDEEDKDG